MQSREGKTEVSFLDSIGSGIDRIIGVFSPKKEALRTYHRVQAGKVRRQYAAAKTTRLTGSWSPVDSNVNTIIGLSSATVRARVRQLVRDFPYFSRAVDIMTDYTVGSGIFFQSRVEGMDGKLNKAMIQKIEDAFNFWADECDIAGKLHYYEMMSLAKRQDLESGEFLIVKEKNPNGKYLPFGLQIYEADWLTDLDTVPESPGNKITQGIEYEKDTGRVVAYHLADPDTYGKTKRIEAENVIHGFKTLRPQQLRGISPFTPAVLVANDLHNYLDAEIDAAKLASKYLAFVKVPDVVSRQLNVGTTTDSETGQKIEEMENAIIEYLNPGEEVEIVSNPRPGRNFPPFVKLILSMVAVTINVPYELLSGDYQGMNYSTSRTVRNDFAHQLKPISGRHIRHFGMSTFKAFMDQAVLRGKLSLPGYWANPLFYLKSEWQPPGMESVDPLRETKARIDEVKAGLRSPYEIVKSRGRDLEDVYREIQRAKELAEAFGLDFDKFVSTGLKNNPAAVMGE